MAERLTYRAAGVDVAAADKLVRHIKRLAAATSRPEIVAGVGGFGALFRLPKGYRRPLLVAATDGVGTKLRVAMMLRRHDTVGIDLVAMNVNDILTIGAEPIAFLDYFATGRLRPRIAAEVVRGIAAGCQQAGCALVGGETAELPSFYSDGEYDLAGFVVGAVEEGKVIDGRRIRPRDVLIGLPSNGLHSNGFSLVRKLVFEKARLSGKDRPRALEGAVGETLLRPTRIYVPLVREILSRYRVKGMAHITGGGMTDNLPRILPAGCGALVRRNSWPQPPVFSFLREIGQLGESEMYRTFNMGVGFVLVAEPRQAVAIQRFLRDRGEPAFHIGEICAGPRRVRYTN